MFFWTTNEVFFVCVNSSVHRQLSISLSVHNNDWHLVVSLDITHQHSQIKYQTLGENEEEQSCSTIYNSMARKVLCDLGNHSMLLWMMMLVHGPINYGTPIWGVEICRFQFSCSPTTKYSCAFAKILTILK